MTIHLVICGKETVSTTTNQIPWSLLIIRPNTTIVDQYLPALWTSSDPEYCPVNIWTLSETNVNPAQPGYMSMELNRNVMIEYDEFNFTATVVRTIPSFEGNWTVYVQGQTAGGVWANIEYNFEVTHCNWLTQKVMMNPQAPIGNFSYPAFNQFSYNYNQNLWGTPGMKFDKLTVKRNEFELWVDYSWKNQDYQRPWFSLRELVDKFFWLRDGGCPVWRLSIDDQFNQTITEESGWGVYQRWVNPDGKIAQYWDRPWDFINDNVNPIVKFHTNVDSPNGNIHNQVWKFTLRVETKGEVVYHFPINLNIQVCAGEVITVNQQFFHRQFAIGPAAIPYDTPMSDYFVSNDTQCPLLFFSIN